MKAKKEPPGWILELTEGQIGGTCWNQCSEMEYPDCRMDRYGPVYAGLVSVANPTAHEQTELKSIPIHEGAMLAY